VLFTTLIGTEELAAHLDDAGFVVVDCRFDLKDTSSGERAYEAGHIPGAVYAHLDRDLSGVKTGRNGRHPLPPPDRVAETLGRLGVGNGTQVVAYDQGLGTYASRLWWMLRWLGHDAVAVLDGGFEKWQREGRPTTRTLEARPAVRFVPHVRSDMLASTEEVAARSKERWLLLDARAPERFRGDVEPIDNAAGHIPGARNHFHESNLNEDGTFLSSADLAARFEQSLRGTPADRVICYCGSGVTACQDLLSLERAGLHGAKLYAGSWSEWASDPTRPIEKG
jgi:thiosulfate/3-mercaptopyruvate sulfurtransferase